MSGQKQVNEFLSTDGIRTWRHGAFPMPEWMRVHIVGGIEANGTFAIKTELGEARVHLGNVVIERCGSVWARPVEEAAEFVDDLRSSTLEISSVGPGKVRQFGIGLRKRTAGKAKFPTDRGFQQRPVVGAPPSIEWIKLDLLSVDSAYQRSTENDASRRLIAGIAAKFDWRLCAPLVVSRRGDEALVIIDGQHRWMAARKRDDIPHLPCCIFRYESTQEEARMFILANRARKPMNRLDDFYAALAASDEDALEIQQIVVDAGLVVARNTSSTSWAPGEVAFTASIANAIRRHGVQLTSAVLVNMAEAFPGQKLTHGGAIFGGLIRIMANQALALDPDRLVDVLQSRSADEWGVFAAGLNGGDARMQALEKAIMDAYGHETAPFAASDQAPAG